MWSNICGIDGSEVKALIVDLRATFHKLDHHVTKERFAVSVNGSENRREKVVAEPMSIIRKSNGLASTRKPWGPMSRPSDTIGGDSEQVRDCGMAEMLRREVFATTLSASNQMPYITQSVS